MKKNNLTSFDLFGLIHSALLESYETSAAEVFFNFKDDADMELLHELITKDIISYLDGEGSFSHGARVKYQQLITLLKVTTIAVEDRCVNDDKFIECVFKNIKSVSFKKCTFAASSLPETLDASSYTQCHFKKPVDARIIADVDNFKKGTSDFFMMCTFFENVVLKGNKGFLNPGACILPNSPFIACNYLKMIKFEDVEFSESFYFFFNKKNNKGFPKLLVIVGCDVKGDTQLNSINSKRCFIRNTKFNGKFECKESKFNKFVFVNSNVKGIADFFKSEFSCSIHVEKSIFESFFGFENVEIGKKHTNCPAVFKYSTFLDFANFRSSIFLRGLDIERANFSQSPNFLHSKVEPINTPRETFRLIKHSFDDIGNYIEANRFFALEMEQNKEDLKSNTKESLIISEKERNKVKSDLLIFRFNQFFSDFGQNWKRPFWLILALAVISQFFYCGLEDVGAHNSAAVSIFCEFSDVTKDFLCNNTAGWIVILILISIFYLWFFQRLPMILIGLIILIVLLNIIGVIVPISFILAPVIDFLNHVVAQVPPFNKLLVEGHELVSFVINILFAILIWQLVVSVKRLTRR